MRFVLIHVPKTGGTTVANFFKSRRSPGWRNDFSLLNHNLPVHAGYHEVMERFGDIISGYYSFAFYRNTWDWAFSFYRYLRSRPSHPQHKRVAQLSFEEWVLEAAHEDYRPQSAMVTIDGKQVVSDLIRFEDFPIEFPKILSNLGYENTAFKSFNVTGVESYREAYTRKSMLRISELYEEDIKFFGFKF